MNKFREIVMQNILQLEMSENFCKNVRNKKKTEESRKI